jgi:pyruvate/2-oxoglutarate/acetoin dehydrogenase E1 component
MKDDELLDAFRRVLDPRTISPLDRHTVLDSFARTNRMVIAQEAVTDSGVGAEIAAESVTRAVRAVVTSEPHMHMPSCHENKEQP